MAFKSSIVSYPQRGDWGNNKFPGNFSGHLVKDFLELVHPNPKNLFCDPTEGGGTSRDVAQEMGIRYRGFDLATNDFSLLHDDLGQALGEHAQTIVLHPPYMGMVKFSDRPEDLSNARSLEEFLE